MSAAAAANNVVSRIGRSALARYAHPEGNVDQNTFDRLSRYFATGLSRRSLAGLAGLGLASVAMAPDGLEAKKKKKCKGGLTRCTVKKGKKKKATCVNVQNDTAHCGGCGRACAGGQRCSNGACVDGACTPDPKAVTCESKCGAVVNNCQQSVNCGVCGCLPITTTSALQAAIDAVDPGETLTLCAGTWNITAQLNISDDMTLKGAGAGQTILDGNDAVRVLHIEEDAVVDLEDMTIQKGLAIGADNRGGGIRNDGTLEMRRVEVTDCEALHGGGVVNFGVLDLYDGTQIRENRATQNGGGLDAWQNSVTTMHDGSRVSNNTGVHGGGVNLFACQLTLGSGSRISGNTGTSDIGGIYSLSATVVLQDGSLVGGSNPGDGNHGSSHGGGIYASSGTLTLESGSRVIGNTATLGAGIASSYSAVTVRNGARVTGNVANSNGGGVHVFAGTATVEADALVCDNAPLNAQCVGTVSGQCPAPAEACPV